MRERSPPAQRRPWRRTATALAVCLAATAPLAPLLEAGQTPSEVLLAAGAPRVGELGPGESRAYRVEPAAGGTWLLTVEQRGLDVVVELTGPDGAVTAIDGPFDRRGVESVLIENASPGGYRLVIRANEPGAPAGGYEVRVRELAAGGAGAAGENGRLAAERAMTAAGRAYQTGDRREALARYREALAAYRAAAADAEAARALYAAAVVARLVNDGKGALADAEAAVTAYQRLGDRAGEADAWNEVGLDRWLLGETAAARERFARALALHRELGEPYGEAVASANLCLMDLVAGELRAGADCYERALPLLHAAGAAALEGAARISAGRAWDVLGEPLRARDQYRQALELMGATANRLGEAQVLNNLAVLAQETGELPQALAQYDRALAIVRELDDRRWQARVLGNLGLAYDDLGEGERAAAYYRQALPLWREVADRRGEAATLTNLGQLELRRGETAEALASTEQALDLRRATEDRRGEALALVQLGRVRLAQGDAAAALAAFTDARERLAGMGDRPDEAAARRDEGRAYDALGEPERAVESLHLALDLDRAVGQRAGEAQTLFALAGAERSLGGVGSGPTTARADVEAALDVVESLRIRIPNPDLRASYAAVQHPAYELLVDLRMAEHQADPAAGADRAALEAAERARARSLADLLAEARVDVRAGVDADLLARREALVERLSAKAERALRGAPPGAGEGAAQEAERVEILQQLDLVEGEIRRASPAYAELTRPTPLTVPEIQDLLDPETLLLVYSLGEERSFLWAVSADRLASFELPPRAQLEAAAEDVHRRLSAFAPAAADENARAASALSRTLLGPVAERLGDRRLVVVADGALQVVPFGALPEPAPAAMEAAGSTNAGPTVGPSIGPTEPLLARHEVVMLPSASVLALLRRLEASRSPAPRRVAILADPVFAADDSRVAVAEQAERTEHTETAEAPRVGDAAPTPQPSRGTVRRRGLPALARLFWSRREAEAIAALAPPDQTMVALDFAADLARAEGPDLASYRAVHFATHGVIDTREPALSGLVLSLVDRRGLPQDGFLDLHAIYNLRLKADLVVLSGCETALGKEVRGEGLVGLIRGFMYAGAPRVVASLWRVEDRATAELMSRFYRALWEEGRPPAAALRAAQLAVAGERRWRDPYFWAGWVLVGDWR